jgi:hypothetical protein
MLVRTPDHTVVPLRVPSVTLALVTLTSLPLPTSVCVAGGLWTRPRCLQASLEQGLQAAQQLLTVRRAVVAAAVVVRPPRRLHRQHPEARQ